MSKELRVRSAPSPSGTIHAGNLKCFVINYLFSKKNNSQFLLRIEDSDQSRVVAGGAEKILDDMKWVGVVPTMGWGTDNKPAGAYTQMERLPIYKEYAEKLVEKGLAYKCYCSKEELDKKREEAFAKNPKAPFRYNGKCRDVKENKDLPYVIRFKTPTEGFTEFNDIAFGKCKVPNKENYDFVIFRGDGSPLFNFANCIDDVVIDKITHVIRGSDHLKNMPQQLMIIDALGAERPIYCHLSMLLNSKGDKLSKRDGAVSVEEFRKLGYSPGALINYLMRFGFSNGDQEIFSLNELINLFELEKIGKNDGRFDYAKLNAINFEHLRSKELTPDEDYARLLLPFLRARGIDPSPEEIYPILPLIRDKAKNFIEAAEKIDFFFRPNVNLDKSLTDKFFTSDTISILNDFSKALSNIEWSEVSLRTATQNWLGSKNISLKEIGQPLRVAITGQLVSPELFQTMQALGKNTVIKRLQNIV